MFTVKRKCPKCRHRKPADLFYCQWCEKCCHEARDEIMRLIGYTISFSHRDLNDDAQECWDEAWQRAMQLPADFPEFGALSALLSDICPMPENAQ